MTMHAARSERSMEERATRLESHFEHIQTDVTEMKADIRRLDQKFDSLKDSVSELRLSMERSFHKFTLWGLTLYFALATSLLGVMAKGFGWIK
jgi:predicted nuclease with TOPRIM domain